jgi:hypothetical protein
MCLFIDVVFELYKRDFFILFIHEKNIEVNE